MRLASKSIVARQRKQWQARVHFAQLCKYIGEELLCSRGCNEEKEIGIKHECPRAPILYVVGGVNKHNACVQKFGNKCRKENFAGKKESCSTRGTFSETNLSEPITFQK